MPRTRNQILTSTCLLICFCGFARLAWYFSNDRLTRNSVAENAFNGSKSDGPSANESTLTSIVTQSLASPATKAILQCSGMPASQIQETEPSSLDARIYRTFVSESITSARIARSLPAAARSKLVQEIGLPFDAAERAFKLYDSHRRAYNKCDYKLLHDPGPCDRTLVSTIIVVHSLPQSKTRRMNIRQRLSRFRQDGYRTVFLIGRSESVPQDELKTEAKSYDDIIWADFEEDYHNLTIKTLTMLRWTERNCQAARHLVKVDDDVQLNITNLGALLKTNYGSRRTIFGCINSKMVPFRDIRKKWYMPMYMYDKPVFPPFPHGPCYALTTELLPELNSKAFSLNYIHLEDIFVAICMNLLKDIHHMNVPRFISETCSDSEAIAYHRLAC